MPINLDHVIVSARDQRASAKRLAELLGVPWAETGAGPFSPVCVNDGLTLDFIGDNGPFPVEHFCFPAPPQLPFDIPVEIKAELELRPPQCIAGLSFVHRMTR